MRETVFEDAKRAALSPDCEQAGLLSARPASDAAGHRPLNANARARQRPADVCLPLPRGIHGSQMALDFVCTSGMRANNLLTAGQSPETIISNYEQIKKDFTPPGETASTAALCTQQGVTFTPCVLEAHSGGWSKGVSTVLYFIAKHASAVTGEDLGLTTRNIAQRISITLQRENARAVLRRMTEPDVEAPRQTTGNVDTGLESWMADFVGTTD